MSRKAGSRLPAAEQTRARVEQAVPGLTRRQLSYWVEKGWVTPQRSVQGHPREFSESELRVLAAMGRLIAAGFGPELAATVARRAVQEAGRLEPRWAEVPLGDAVVVAVYA